MKRVVELLAGRGADADYGSLVPVDMARLLRHEWSPVRCVIDLLLPRGAMTLLSAHGDLGKTMISLTFAAHVAVGRQFAGLHVVQGRCAFVSLEDVPDRLLERLEWISSAYGFDRAAVTAGVQVFCLGKGPPALMQEMTNEGVHEVVPTLRMEQLRRSVNGFDLIIIDHATKAFGGNVNDLRQVDEFIRRLADIARKNDAAVMLLAHIDKLGARNGTNGNTYLGSVAWHASPRSRIALSESKDKGIQLVHEKHNDTRGAKPITLVRGEFGVLTVEDPAIAAAAGANRDRDDNEALLRALRSARAKGADIPTARQGRNTAQRALREAGGLARDYTSGRIHDLLERLVADGRVVVTRVRRDGRECARYDVGPVDANSLDREIAIPANSRIDVQLVDKSTDIPPRTPPRIPVSSGGRGKSSHAGSSPGGEFPPATPSEAHDAWLSPADDETKALFTKMREEAR